MLVSRLKLKTYKYMLIQKQFWKEVHFLSPIDTRRENLIHVVANNLLVPCNLWFWWTVSRVKHTIVLLLIQDDTICLFYLQASGQQGRYTGVLSLGYLNQDIFFFVFFFQHSKHWKLHFIFAHTALLLLSREMKEEWFYLSLYGHF